MNEQNPNIHLLESHTGPGREVQSLEAVGTIPGTHGKESPAGMVLNADGNSQFFLGVHDLLVP